MTVAVALDTVAALAIVALAAAWLARRAVATMGKRTSSGCACPGASTCGAIVPPKDAVGGPGAADFRAAAARAVGRLEGRAPQGRGGPGSNSGG